MRSSVDALIGLAVGDAVGVPVEFVSRERLQQNPVTGIREYGSHNVPAGTWSDDTSMTIATMRAIVDRKDIDYQEIMNNYYLWLSENRFTADGRVFDVGRTCLRAVMKWAKEHCDPVSAGKEGERYNGNGSLMRFLPIPFYCYARKLEEQEVVELCGEMSSLTHRHEISQLGCYIYTLFMMQLLQHGDKELAYEYIRNEAYEFYSQESVEAYSRLLKDDVRLLKEEEIESTGYIVFTLEAAIWCLLTENNYESIILKAVNLGHDTDTIAAVAGSMAGIIYGIDEIPAEWVSVLQKKECLIGLAKEFDEAIDPAESNLRQAFLNNINRITHIEFERGGCFGGYEKYDILINNNNAIWRFRIVYSAEMGEEIIDPEEIINQLKDKHVWLWEREYHNNDILDGEQWELAIHFSSGKPMLHSYGSNEYPNGFEELASAIQRKDHVG